MNTIARRIDIGAGTNTVRLDNVGLINGGVGLRMDSAADEPAGVAPGRPLFLIANDLEVDFAALNAIELLAGEDAQISNSYIQVCQVDGHIASPTQCTLIQKDGCMNSMPSSQSNVTQSEMISDEIVNACVGRRIIYPRPSY